MPISKLQDELRKTFARETGSQVGEPAPRSRATAGKRDTAVALRRDRGQTSRRRHADTGSRRSGNAQVRTSAVARRKLTSPIDPALYKRLQLESIESDRPIREIIESMLKERYAQDDS